MDKTKLGFVGAISSLAAAGGLAVATPAAAGPLARATSYAQLLEPISNPVERLALINSQSRPDGARLIEAQYGPDGGPVVHHHHHHHHHQVYHRRHHRRVVHHHHHHHHHHNNY